MSSFRVTPKDKAYFESITRLSLRTCVIRCCIICTEFYLITWNCIHLTVYRPVCLRTILGWFSRINKIVTSKRDLKPFLYFIWAHKNAYSFIPSLHSRPSSLLVTLVTMCYTYSCHIVIIGWMSRSSAERSNALCAELDTYGVINWAPDFLMRNEVKGADCDHDQKY